MCESKILEEKENNSSPPHLIFTLLAYGSTKHHLKARQYLKQDAG